MSTGDTKSMKPSISKAKKQLNSSPKNVGSRTVEHILDAAQRVLVNNGYAGFTMRQVAKTAGISPGNLTYHFPTKNELLKSLIRRLLEGYINQLDTHLCGPEEPTGQQIEALVYWAMMENVDEETVRISREIWAMALHDNAIRDMVDDFYDDLMESFVTTLNRSRPDMDRDVIRELVHFLLLLAEGTAVLFGTRRNRTVSVEHMIKVASRILGKIP